MCQIGSRVHGVYLWHQDCEELKEDLDEDEYESTKQGDIAAHPFPCKS